MDRSREKPQTVALHDLGRNIANAYPLLAIRGDGEVNPTI
jgi:hypothetical protein